MGSVFRTPVTPPVFLYSIPNVNQTEGWRQERDRGTREAEKKEARWRLKEPTTGAHVYMSMRIFAL